MLGKKAIMGLIARGARQRSAYYNSHGNWKNWDDHHYPEGAL